MLRFACPSAIGCGRAAGIPSLQVKYANMPDAWVYMLRSRRHILDRPVALTNEGGRPRRRIDDPHPAVMPGTLDCYVWPGKHAVWGANPPGAMGTLQVNKHGRCQQDANAGGRPHSRGLR